MTSEPATVRSHARVSWGLAIAIAFVAEFLTAVVATVVGVAVLAMGVSSIQSGASSEEEAWSSLFTAVGVGLLFAVLVAVAVGGVFFEKVTGQFSDFALTYGRAVAAAGAACAMGVVTSVLMLVASERGSLPGGGVTSAVAFLVQVCAVLGVPAAIVRRSARPAIPRGL